MPTRRCRPIRVTPFTTRRSHDGFTGDGSRRGLVLWGTIRSTRPVLVGASCVVFVAVRESWFDWVWCEELRCRCDTALTERVSAPHRLSDHEAAEELEDGVLLDAFRQQRSFGGGCMRAESGSLAHCQQAYGRWGGGTRATSGCDPAAVVSSSCAQRRFGRRWP